MCDAEPKSEDEKFRQRQMREYFIGWGNPSVLKRLWCWLRGGHRWAPDFRKNEERFCGRCKLYQYAAVEDENGGKSWETAK